MGTSTWEYVKHLHINGECMGRESREHWNTRTRPCQRGNGNMGTWERTFPHIGYALWEREIVTCCSAAHISDPMVMFKGDFLSKICDCVDERYTIPCPPVPITIRAMYNISTIIFMGDTQHSTLDMTTN